MKSKLTFALLSLPLALLSFKKEDNAKALVHKTASICDTAFLYPALILKQAELNLQPALNSLVVTNESGDSRAKLQLKAYLDSLTIGVSPAGVTGVKKQAKVKTMEREKRAGDVHKRNNLSRSANRVQNSRKMVPSDQFPGHL